MLQVPSVVPVVRPARAASRSGRSAPSTRACRRPQSAACRLPRGNGETIRLARGASLSDFADKIDANPAALVQALFNLGEMVTATQSVNDETLELLGGEMNYVVQVVSPEDEDRELLDSFDLTYGEDAGGEEDLESVRRWSPSWATSTTVRPDCWTRSVRPTSARARPAASRSTSVPTRC